MTILPAWLLIVLGTGAVLLAAKLLYGISVAIALPTTRGALFVSTTRPRIAAALEAARPAEGSLLADLGCGDGRVLRHASRRYEVFAVGYEVNPLAWLKASLLCLADRRVRVRYRDFRKADLNEADIVTCYLFPDVMNDVSAAFEAGRFKSGGTLISFNFPLPGVVASRVLHPEGGLHRDPIFIYEIP